MRRALPLLSLAPASSAALAGVGLALGLALATGGCSLLFDDEAGRAECNLDSDCLSPIREQCDPVSRRCVPRPVTVGTDADLPAEDARAPADARPVDMAPGDLAPPDLGPLDATPADAAPAPDAEPPPAFDCFDGTPDGRLAQPTAIQGRVPWAFCTPAALAWTLPDAEGVALWRWRADGPPEVIARLPADVQPVVSADALYHVTPNPEVGATPNLRRVDLLDGAADFVLPRAGAQGQPAVYAEDLAFVQRNSGRDTVVVIRPALGRVDCRAPLTNQWGPALGPDWVAWFERSDAGRVEVVIARDVACQDRVAVPLRTAPPETAQLVAAGRRLYWLQPAADGRQHLWRLDRDDLASPAVDLDADAGTHRVSLSGAGGWIATTRYVPGRYVVEALAASDERRRVTTPNPTSARHPTLGGGHLLWAEQDGSGRWTLHHQPLPEASP